MEKRQQVMELWRNNFHDSEEFIRFYFAHKYSESHSLVYESDGAIQSALLMLPYPMTWEGTTLTTSYISGACTQPEARNRGIMPMLLQRAFAEMHERNIAFSTLIPAEEWLFDYYARLGYAPVFEYSSRLYNMEIPESGTALSVFSPEAYQEQWASAFFPYFNRHMAARPTCVQHPYDDFSAIMQDLYMSGGRIVAVIGETPENPLGIALVLPQDEQISVKEMFCENTTAQKALLSAIGKHLPNLPIVVRTPPQGPETHRLGMARITHAGQLLQHMAHMHPEISLTLQLNDPQLSENQGIYTLKQGECRQTDFTSKPIDITTDINTLTSALLGYRTEQLPQALSPLFTTARAYMNLMLE